MTVRFRIVGTDMPGSGYMRAQGFEEDRANVHVGIQRGSEVIDLVSGDAPEARFEIDVPVNSGRFAGPFVHGQRGERFLYLSWGELTEDGDEGKSEFTMFRRAKIHLDTLDAAALEGAVVEGRLKMSDAGGPVCASVRPPAIRWTQLPSEPLDR
jgi:hypothetical protein